MDIEKAFRALALLSKAKNDYLPLGLVQLELNGLGLSEAEEKELTLMATYEFQFNVDPLLKACQTLAMALPEAQFESLVGRLSPDGSTVQLFCPDLGLLKQAQDILHNENLH